jgi:hypothetical protein
MRLHRGHHPIDSKGDFVALQMEAKIKSSCTREEAHDAGKTIGRSFGYAGTRLGLSGLAYRHRRLRSDRRRRVVRLLLLVSAIASSPPTRARRNGPDGVA